MYGLMWTFSQFLNSLNGSINNWASVGVAVLGAVVLFVGIFQVAKGLMGGGHGQTNWPVAIGAIVIGGIMMFTGWTTFQTIGNGIGTEVNGMGNGTTAGGGEAIVYTID